MAGGWCPRHDRTYARGARCPSCKTPLIALEDLAAHQVQRDAPAALSGPGFASPVAAAATSERDGPFDGDAFDGDPRVPVFVGEDDDRQAEDPPPARRARLAPVLVAAALVAAFALGTTVSGRAPKSVVPRPAATVRSDSRPLLVVSLTTASLRLDRITQLGGQIEAHVSVLEGLEEGTLRHVFVEVTTEDGETVFVEDVRVEPDVARFTASFSLPDPTVHITRFRITGLQMQSDRPPVRMRAEVKAPWPVAKADEPVRLRIDQDASLAGIAFRWSLLLLWQNRIEIVLDVGESEIDIEHHFADAALFDEDPSGDLIPVNADGARVDGNRVHLSFDGLRDATRRIVLMLPAPTTTIEGLWSWPVDRRDGTR